MKQQSNVVMLERYFKKLVKRGFKTFKLDLEEIKYDCDADNIANDLYQQLQIIGGDYCE